MKTIGLILLDTGVLAFLIGSVVVISNLTGQIASSTCAKALADESKFMEARRKCNNLYEKGYDRQEKVNSCFSGETSWLTNSSDCERAKSDRNWEIMMAGLPMVIGLLLAVVGFFLWWRQRKVPGKVNKTIILKIFGGLLILGGLLVILGGSALSVKILFGESSFCKEAQAEYAALEKAKQDLEAAKAKNGSDYYKEASKVKETSEKFMRYSASCANARHYDNRAAVIFGLIAVQGVILLIAGIKFLLKKATT